MMYSTRRRFLQTLAASGAMLGLGAERAWGQAEANGEASAADLVTPEADKSIDKGLAYLAARQNDDGSFGFGGYSRNVAVVALGGMAFMSSGSTPGRGPYGAKVERGLAYLLASQDDTGFITAPEAASHGPMYGHGFATLFLAEVYGMTPLSDVRERLVKAVKVIIESQNPEEGGWRYEPQRTEPDISVTVCQIMALRAARNAGIYVPHDTIEKSIAYVKRSQNADGGFMYMLQGGASAFPRSAAGVVALYSAGIYEGEEVKKGLDYLLKHAPRNDVVAADHYYYGHYYAAQAMWQSGGDNWQKWYPAIRDTLVHRQRTDGSWTDENICPEYCTAMACLILQMPNNYLPIFQR